MPTRDLDPDHNLSEDWHGNNIAVTCPACGKVYVVSGFLEPNGRECPNCHRSTGRVDGSRRDGGTARIEW